MNAFFNAIKDMSDSFAESLTASNFLYVVIGVAFGVFAVFFVVSFFLYRDRTMRKLKAITRKVEKTEISSDNVWEIRGDVAEIPELDRGMTEVAAGLGRAKPSRYLRFSMIKQKSTNLCFIIYNIVMFLVTAAVIFLTTGYMANYPVQGIFTISLLLGMQAIYFGIFAISEEIRKRIFAKTFENFVSALEKKCNAYKPDPRIYAREEEEDIVRPEIVDERSGRMRNFQPQSRPVSPMGQMPPRAVQMPPQGGMVPPMGQQVPPRPAMQPMGAPMQGQQAQAANFGMRPPHMAGGPINPPNGYRPDRDGMQTNAAREEEKFDAYKQEEKDEAIEIDLSKPQESRAVFEEEPPQESEEVISNEDEPSDEEIDDAVIEEIIKDAESDEDELNEDESDGEAQDEAYIDDEESEEEDDSEEEDEDDSEDEEDAQADEDERVVAEDGDEDEEDQNAEEDSDGEEEPEVEEEAREEIAEDQEQAAAQSPYKGAYETKAKEEKSVVDEELDKMRAAETRQEEGMIAKDDKDEIAKYLASKRKRERIVAPEPKPAQQTLSGTDRTMQQIALLLQKEREKKSSKNPEEQKRINEALTDLLREIGKSGK